MNVRIRVCKDHHLPTTRHCAFAGRIDGRIRTSCPQVFCKQCIADRKPLMTDDLSTEMGHLLYNNHFYDYLEENSKGGVDVMLHK